jgi:hypothetical protein
MSGPPRALTWASATSIPLCQSLPKNVPLPLNDSTDPSFQVVPVPIVFGSIGPR